MPITEHDALKDAVDFAMLSPCQKSKRGVIIFNASAVFAHGINGPPRPFVCTGDEACRAACGKISVHAEQRALMSYVPGRDTEAYLLHVKAEDGVAVPSGPPSCWQCSRLILDELTIRGVWLLHEDGLRLYTPYEFHRLTLEHCGLPMIEQAPHGRQICTCSDERCTRSHGKNA